MTRAKKEVSRKDRGLRFARLPDGREICATVRHVMVPQGVGWSPAEEMRWTFALEGRSFTLWDGEKQKPLEHLYLGNIVVMKVEDAPLELGPNGDRLEVTFDDYYSHHLGSVSSTVRLVVDVAAMRIDYFAVHQVDLD
jgi:hypothetical protein